MKENGFFVIRPKGDPILLYGENAFARKTYHYLYEHGYNVKGFIDKKYQDHTKGNISLEKVNHIKDIDTYIVIICLQNGIQHEKTAELLYHKGIQKLIFLPMEIRGSLRNQETYRRIYRFVQEFSYEKIDRVPIYCVYEKPRFIEIDHREHEVSFWCPMEYLHTISKELCPHKNFADLPENDMQMMSEYLDVPVEQNKAYRMLFRWLQGDYEADLTPYFTIMGYRSQEEKEAFIDDRKYLYQVYEEAFRYNMGFFMDSPSRGIWNPNGYYNIWDGMHRIQYLYMKGYDCMPVAVSGKDYTRFREFASNVTVHTSGAHSNGIQPIGSSPAAKG